MSSVSEVKILFALKNFLADLPFEIICREMESNCVWKLLFGTIHRIYITEALGFNVDIQGDFPKENFLKYFWWTSLKFKEQINF